MRLDVSRRGRPLRRPAVFFLLLALSPLAVNARADYPGELVQRAADARLSQDPEWRTLVHYRAGLAGPVSLIDDPRFFLAPDGKRNPDAELAATIHAFFLPPSTNEYEHAVCRFPARLDWLSRKLEIDPARLPVPACGPYDRTISTFKPQTIALAYPAAYMNGPASMFGHTLLVVDGAGRNRLLSRAISYAARTKPTIGPVFAFAGIFGFYPGYYAYQSYYEKTQQYGDIGHRDVWEYELDLTPEEIDRLMRHAWELQNIYSWYYFFDENCAYNILYLLDVARPSLGLTKELPWFVIPIDSVRWVGDAGLVRAVNYRPSPVTEMKHRLSTLSPEHRALAIDVSKGQRTVESLMAIEDVATRRDVMDLSVDYLKYQLAEKTVAVSNYSPRLLSILKPRSTLGVSEPLVIDRPVRPDHGHSPMRATLAGGVSDGDAIGEFRWRLAYHALEDADDGFTRGAQIQFLNTHIRWTEESARLRRLDLVDVFSIAPRDQLFRPSSWKVRMGFERDPVDEESWMGLVNTGAGLATERGPFDLSWGFIEAEAGWRESFEAGWQASLGPALGVMHQVTDDWKHLLQARMLYDPKEDAWLWNAAWAQDYRLVADCSIGLEARWDDVDGQTRATTALMLHTYW